MTEKMPALRKTKKGKGNMELDEVPVPVKMILKT